MSVAAKRQARNNTIEAFDLAVRALRGYLDTWPDADERWRLVGVEPALRDVRHRFELATSEEP